MDSETLPQNNTYSRPRREKVVEEEETEETDGLSKTGWWLLIGALATIDAIQIALDLFVIGVALNRFIDIGVAMALPFFLHMSGENVMEPKKLLALAATFLGEEIPVVDALPLWTADGLYYYFMSKVNKKVPMANKVLLGANKIKSLKNISVSPKSDTKETGQKGQGDEQKKQTGKKTEAEKNTENKNGAEKEKQKNKSNENGEQNQTTQNRTTKKPRKVVGLQEQKNKIEGTENDIARIERQKTEAELDIEREKQKLAELEKNNTDEQQKKICKMLIDGNQNLLYSLNVRLNMLKKDLDAEKIGLIEIEQENYRAEKTTV